VVQPSQGAMAQGIGPVAGSPLPTMPPHLAGNTADTTGIGAGLAGLGTLIALSVISLAVTLGRRAHARRRVEARITARLASFGAPSGPGERPRSVEHEGRTLS
jgi:hypothetical protein